MCIRDSCTTVERWECELIGTNPCSDYELVELSRRKSELCRMCINYHIKCRPQSTCMSVSFTALSSNNDRSPPSSSMNTVHAVVTLFSFKQPSVDIVLW